MNRDLIADVVSFAVDADSEEGRYRERMAAGLAFGLGLHKGTEERETLLLVRDASRLAFLD